LGSSEMIIGNIGTVVTSILPRGAHASRALSNQVQLLSVANTLSRLASGPLIDLFCPEPTPRARRKFTVSRLAFVVAGGIIQVGCYAYMSFFTKSEKQVWVLSLGIGTAYGLIWTVVPGIVKVIWGEANLGRNFGMLSYAPCLGTTLWTYLFVFNVEREGDPGQDHCMGSKCWQTTFRICLIVIAVVVVSLFQLWRKLGDRV